MAVILDGRHPASKELCEAFGLDASLTRSIAFSLAVDRVAVLTVQRFIENEELMKAAGVLKKFKLVELEDHKGINTDFEP